MRYKGFPCDSAFCTQIILRYNPTPYPRSLAEFIIYTCASISHFAKLCTIWGLELLLDRPLRCIPVLFPLSHRLPIFAYPLGSVRWRFIVSAYYEDEKPSHDDKESG